MRAVLSEVVGVWEILKLCYRSDVDGSDLT